MPSASDPRSLDSLLAARSVAVVGASPRAGHFANQPLVNLRRFGFGGDVFPVNPRHEEVEGWRCYPSVDALPSTPDLAIVVVTPATAVDAVAGCAARGVGAAVVVASGFAESGEQTGVALQRELSDIARRTGIRVCGPNTLGVANWIDRVVPFSSGNIPAEPRVGPVAIVSQSGGLGFTLLNRAWALGVGVGHLAVAGNEADVTIPDLINWYLERDDVRAVLCYMEAVRDPEGLQRVGVRSAEVGKPVFVLKSGRTAQGQLAAAAHTGALATSDAVCDAALRQWGLRRVTSLDGLLNAAALAARFEPPRGAGVGVYCQGGGIAVVSADLFARHGLDLPPLADDTKARILAIMPDATAANPFDSGGQFLSRGADPLVEALAAFDEDPAVGVVVAMSMPVLGHRADLYTEGLVRAAAHSEKPYVVVQLGAGELTAGAERRFREADLVVLDTPDEALEGLAAWLASAEPVAARPVAAPKSDRATAARSLVERWRGDGLVTVPEHEAIALLSLYGIPVAAQELATSPDRALEVARRLGGPLAIKVASPDIAHRSDVGGVALGVDVEDAANAYNEVTRRAGQQCPGAVLVGATVAAMAAPGRELIAGMSRDPTFGPTVVLGLGGVLAELLDDVAILLPPFDMSSARALLSALRGAALLSGHRGSPGVDVDAVLDIAMRLQEIVVDVGDELTAIDLNPVMAYPSGRSAVVVDALIELRPLDALGPNEVTS